MSCNTCITVCPIHPIYNNLWVCKLAPLTEYLVVIKKHGANRQVSELVTTDADGLLKLTNGTLNDFFNSASQFELKVYMSNFSQSPSQTTNNSEDFYTIEGFEGAYYNLEPSFSSTQYDCILFNTEMLYDGDGSPLEIDDQYLIHD